MSVEDRSERLPIAGEHLSANSLSFVGYEYQNVIEYLQKYAVVP